MKIRLYCLCPVKEVQVEKTVRSGNEKPGMETWLLAPIKIVGDDEVAASEAERLNCGVVSLDVEFWLG